MISSADSTTFYAGITNRRSTRQFLSSVDSGGIDMTGTFMGIVIRFQLSDLNSEKSEYSQNGAPEFTPLFSGVRVTRSLVYMYVLLIVVCPFVHFLLVVVLSVLLRQTDSDCPFGIFQLFLELCF